MVVDGLIALASGGLEILHDACELVLMNSWQHADHWRSTVIRQLGLKTLELLDGPPQVHLNALAEPPLLALIVLISLLLLFLFLRLTTYNFDTAKLLARRSINQHKNKWFIVCVRVSIHVGCGSGVVFVVFCVKRLMVD